MPIDIIYFDFKTNQLVTRSKTTTRRNVYTYTDLDGVDHNVERTAYGWDIDRADGGTYTFDRLRDAKDFIISNHTKAIG